MTYHLSYSSQASQISLITDILYLLVVQKESTPDYRIIEGVIYSHLDLTFRNHHRKAITAVQLISLADLLLSQGSSSASLNIHPDHYT